MRLKKGALLLALVVLSGIRAAAALWQKMDYKEAPVKTIRTTMPGKYLLYAAAELSLKGTLSAAPATSEGALTIALPMPDGSMMDFKVWKNELMEAGLAAKYPDIQTFTAVSVTDNRITAKLDYTSRGFHAMIFNGANIVFIDPYTDVPTSYYLVYYRSDYTRPDNERMMCQLKDQEDADAAAEPSTGTGLKTVNGNSLRKYRLALACTGEYSTAVGGMTPTKASVLSAMVTSMNRVNGVYERELAVTMQLISNTDDLIYLSTTDPYNNSDGNSMLGDNQTNINSVIGSANYDIGHVFSTGGGGVAILSSVCRTNTKAMGVTGRPSPIGDAFDIDYVAHEMGHQFGSDHTFNNDSSGSCEDNAAQLLAYEPGSGTTIMAYAGICSPDNVQAHSDAYFHAKSLINIMSTITAAAVSSCPVTTASGNKPVFVPAFTTSYSIPYKTPFELTAPQVTDSVGATDITYCWEQWNLGDFRKRFVNTSLRGPITRSYSPDISRTRVFPALPKLLANNLITIGEKLPDTARFLTYKLTARSFFNAVGSISIPDDTIHLDVINTGVPFLVTSPNTTGVSWTGNTTQTITWDVANTTSTPISCANVDIYLSADGGYTYPYLLRSGVANNGSATITVPNINTTTARIKVKGSGNVFFDICNYNLTILRDPSNVSKVNLQELVMVSPVPATDEIWITAHLNSKLQTMLIDQTGRAVWNNMISHSATIRVSHLARGIYFLKVSDAAGGRQMTKKVVLQ